MDNAEYAIHAAICHDAELFTAISWEKIMMATHSDVGMQLLLEAVKAGFPDHARNNHATVASFWNFREGLSVLEGVVLYQDRVVVPPSLCDGVLRTLHSAHQGVSCMEAQARSVVFWPGMTAAIKATRDSCGPCNRSAPSQAALTSP
jgi:hypothetical protein